MKKISDYITLLEDKDLYWNFTDRNEPFYSIKYCDDGYCSTNEYIDPFPCYHHDEKLVNLIVDKIFTISNFKYKPKYYILSHESLSRTNGWASDGQTWDENQKKHVLHPFIVLSGKRISIHPAMTRYLVSHESGHAYEYTLIDLLKTKREDFEREYCKLRGIKFSSVYGARKHHLNTMEVIANDIRIMLFHEEEEFWSHNVDHPNELSKKIWNYWLDINRKYFK